MTTVVETPDIPGGGSPSDVLVTVFLAGEDGLPIGEAYANDLTLVDRYSTRLTTTGIWSLDLVANDNITPSGTVWGRTMAGRSPNGARWTTTTYADVPTTGGPYRWDEIPADPADTITATALAAHAADTDLHGGGQLLGYADRDSNFTTASTDLVDVPGLSITFTVPDRPYRVECGSLCLIEEADQGGGFAIALADNTQLAADRRRAGAANDLAYIGRPIYVPSHHHAPSAGTSVTYKLRVQSTAATSDLQLIASFFGAADAPFIAAYAL